ncbi:hypothetical protein [Mycobacterium saskatchewanense]|uniref:hypothetical protein n=1 Tax=Mycobacterium saskatchewanense TaxID=220927 RepID=UPI0013027D40|nr:hypothetical protein [Mycobacterium saskatchewanense]
MPNPTGIPVGTRWPGARPDTLDGISDGAGVDLADIPRTPTATCTDIRVST